MNDHPIKSLLEIDTKFGRLVLLFISLIVIINISSFISTAIFAKENILSNIAGIILISPFVFLTSHIFTYAGVLIVAGDIIGIAYILRGNQKFFLISAILIF